MKLEMLEVHYNGDMDNYPFKGGFNGEELDTYFEKAAKYVDFSKDTEVKYITFRTEPEYTLYAEEDEHDIAGEVYTGVVPFENVEDWSFHGVEVYDKFLMIVFLNHWVDEELYFVHRKGSKKEETVLVTNKGTVSSSGFIAR